MKAPDADGHIGDLERTRRISHFSTSMRENRKVLRDKAEDVYANIENIHTFLTADLGVISNISGDTTVEPNRTLIVNLFDRERQRQLDHMIRDLEIGVRFHLPELEDQCITYIGNLHRYQNNRTTDGAILREYNTLQKNFLEIVAPAGMQLQQSVIDYLRMKTTTLLQRLLLKLKKKADDYFSF